MGAGFVVASYAQTGWLVVAALWATFAAWNSLQAPALAVPMEFLSGRAAATGIATMNSIAVLSGFVGPYWMGRMKDATGSYSAGLRGLIVPSLIAAGAMASLTMRLARQQRDREMIEERVQDLVAAASPVHRHGQETTVDYPCENDNLLRLGSKLSRAVLQENPLTPGAKGNAKGRSHAD
jgi:hypothetical protein